MRFAFIAKHRGIWPVAWLCEALDVSRSGFHAWLNRGPSRRAQEDQVIGGDAGAVVGDRHHCRAGFGVQRDGDVGVPTGKLDGIADDVGEGLLDEARVGAHERQRRGRRDGDHLTGAAPTGLPGDLGKIRPVAPEFQTAGFQTRHRQEVADHRVEVLGLLLHLRAGPAAPARPCARRSR